MTGKPFTILLYHGVYEDDLALNGRNKSGKHIARDRFERQMAWLADNKPVISLTTAVEAHYGRGEIEPGSVVITFDDGFLNNFLTAWPVLEQHNIPATFYLATGFIGTGRMIWSDVLESAFLGTTREVLDLSEATGLAPLPLDSEAARQSAFLAVKAYCKRLPNQQMRELVDVIAAELSAAPDVDDPLYAFMNWDHVRDMNRSPLVSFGAHTVDHVSLANVPEDVMRFQIDKSVATLEDELQEPCSLFSYPEGQARDFNASVITYLKGRGFNHAPTAMTGVNDLDDTDPFHLYRSMVGFDDLPFPFETPVPL